MALNVLGIAGWSGSGKTTLVTRLIPELTARGYSVSTVKHAHHDFDIDQPGKDSFAHRAAGAREVMVGSAARWALMHELRGAAEPTLDQLLAKLGPVDLILVTHGHGDHVGDTAAIAEMTGAMVALNADLGQTFRTLGMVPGGQLIRFNKSGSIRPLGDGITITMVHAEHSSEIVHKDPETGEQTVHPGGEPAGYIIQLEDGKTIYHAGDTGVFGDMAFIGSYYQPDVALLPIGGHFTMDPAHAAYAVRELLEVKIVVPIHYGTFPPLKGTPEQFKAALGDYPADVVVMQPGEVRDF